MKSPENSIEEALERRILHGLAAEWEYAVSMLPPRNSARP